MNALEALETIKRNIAEYGATNNENDQAIKVIEKELEVLAIMKKYAVNDGWSNGWVIKFWEMNETELKKVNEILGKAGIE